MFSKILAPVDGSKSAEAGAAVAVKLAQATGGSVIFCTAADAFTPPWEVEIQRAALEHSKALAERAGISCETAELRGETAPLIVDFAEQMDVDVVVMGSHGRGLRHAILGSCAEGVLHRAKVPVMIVTPNAANG